MIGREADKRDGLVLGAIGWAGWRSGWRAGRRRHVDDLFFTGVAVNLVGHHGFQNPWYSTWMRQFSTRQFFVQPPLHPFMLARGCE